MGSRMRIDSFDSRTNRHISDSDSNLSDFFASELEGQGPPAGNLSPPIQLGTVAEQGPGRVALNHSGNDTFIPAGTELQREAEEQKDNKRQRMPVPEEQKDGKYWEFRRKNNISAKRSREARRLKMKLEDEKKAQAVQDNIALRAEMNVMRSEISTLRRLLNDANTTLSLWIKARQDTEPDYHLPPSRRHFEYPMGR